MFAYKNLIVISFALMLLSGFLHGFVNCYEDVFCLDLKYFWLGRRFPFWLQCTWFSSSQLVVLWTLFYCYGWFLVSRCCFLLVFIRLAF